MSQTILVVAAHPDDEALGAAGTIARHGAAGDEVFLLFLADGEGARGSLERLEARREATYRAADRMGVARSRVRFLDFPDNRMDSVPFLEIVQAVESLVGSLEPSVIYTHHAGDLNVDHRLTHQAVLTASRPMPGSTVQSIYGFEVLSSTEWSSPAPHTAFVPSRYVDISSFWETKLEALRAYDREMRDSPHARSYRAAEALATLRGAQVGLERAEAFTVIRQIER